MHFLNVKRSYSRNRKNRLDILNFHQFFKLVGSEWNDGTSLSSGTGRCNPSSLHLISGVVAIMNNSGNIVFPG